MSLPTSPRPENPRKKAEGRGVVLGVEGLVSGARSSRASFPRSDALGYGRQLVDQDDVDAVVGILRSEHLTQGPAVARFEAALCASTGAPHAVAVANGTCALQLAYHVLGVGPERGVLTSANTFLATATAAEACGGRAEFVDVDSRTGNLDVDLLEERLARGGPPPVVAAVHFAGLPCDMERLIALKRSWGFALVEDAAHALGARYRVGGRWYDVGEHPEIDATVLSFHPVKHVTTGEGGAVLVHDAERATRLRRLRSHGVDPEGGLELPTRTRRSPEEFGPDGRFSPFKPMLELGFNYRMTDVQAALGTSQMKKLAGFLGRRRDVAERYRAELHDYGLFHAGDADREHAWHLFVLRCEPDERDALMLDLRRRGIGTQVHYYPVPLQPWFRGREHADVSNAIAHARTALSIPIHAGLSDDDQGEVIGALRAWKLRRRRSVA
jgi:dTDP-4-amino-4,6-dideoxygalactose transaminase